MLVTLRWALGRQKWIRTADSTNLSFIPLSPFPLLTFLFCFLPLIETKCHVDMLLGHIYLPCSFQIISLFAQSIIQLILLSFFVEQCKLPYLRIKAENQLFFVSSRINCFGVTLHITTMQFVMCVSTLQPF